MSLSIKKIAIVANLTKAGVGALAAELVQVAEWCGVKAIVHGEYPLAPGALKGCDACAVLGGDGTLLGVVPQAVATQTPVFGINRGKLGFLAFYDSQHADASLEEVLRGDFRIEYRTLLECSSPSGGQTLALNDIVITPSQRTHMTELAVTLDGHYMNSYLCDGLIVSTPTGSTAYNLAAGGPLIAPGTDVFVITPICPHTLSNRSIVVPRDSHLMIAACNGKRNSSLELTVDGIAQTNPGALFPLQISLAAPRLPLLQPTTFSHYQLLRNKLRWA